LKIYQDLNILIKLVCFKRSVTQVFQR